MVDTSGSMTAAVITATDSVTASTMSITGTATIATTSGNVGIGTTTPAVKLTVDGGLAIPNSGTVVSLTADNQAVTVGDLSYIRFTSNNTTSSNRTFTLSSGLNVGHILVLEWTHATNEGELQDNGNVRIAGVWPSATNQLDDVIILIWNGTTWNQIARSAN